MFKKITDVKKGVKALLATAPPYYPIRTANALLSQKQLVPFLKKMPTIVNAPDQVYLSLYYQTLIQFAECVQGLPAIKTKSYNYYGGILDLAVERTYLTLMSYRKEYPLKDTNPEHMPPKLALWTYALFTLGLFYGIGEMGATYWITVTDDRGHNGIRWIPFQEPMARFGSHYRYSFEFMSRDDLAQKSAPILARQLMPYEGFTWIANDKEVFEYWLRILQNIHTDTGILARFLLPVHDVLINQDRPRVGALNTPSWVTEEIEHNAKTTSDSKDTPAKESLTEKERSLAHLNAEIALKDIDMTGASTTEIGELFIHWLRIGIIGQSITVNRNKSSVNITSEGLLLLSPEIFMAFVKSNPNLAVTWHEIYKNVANSGYSWLKAQSFSSQTNVNVAGNVGKTGKLTGVLLDPTVIFNAQFIPAPLTTLQAGVTLQSTYPSMKETLTTKPVPPPG